MFACLYVGRRTFASKYMWWKRPIETDAKTMDIVAELWSVVRIWSRIWVLYDALIYLLKIYWNMDLSDFSAFSIIGEINWQIEPSLHLIAWMKRFTRIIIILLYSIVLWKWIWLTHRVKLYWLYYTVQVKSAYTRSWVILAVLYNVSEIDLHAELSYIGCIIQCNWKWLMRRITFCSLCYVLKSFSLY